MEAIEQMIKPFDDDGSEEEVNVSLSSWWVVNYDDFMHVEPEGDVPTVEDVHLSSWWDWDVDDEDFKFDDDEEKDKDKDKDDGVDEEYDEKEEEEEVDETGVDSYYIDLVMTQTGVSKSKAVKALKTHNGDIVSALMEFVT